MMLSGRSWQFTECGALDRDCGSAPRPQDGVIVDQMDIQFGGLGIPVLSDAVVKAVPTNFCQSDPLTVEENARGQRDVGDGGDEHAEGPGGVADDSVGGGIAGGGEVEDLVVAGWTFREPVTSASGSRSLKEVHRRNRGVLVGLLIARKAQVKSCPRRRGGSSEALPHWERASSFGTRNQMCSRRSSKPVCPSARPGGLPS